MNDQPVSSVAREARPLTAEEEAELRGDIWKDYQLRHHDVLRLLATLDAARATPAGPEERGEGLRDEALDALRAALMWLDGEYVDKPREEFNREAWGRLARRGIAALTAGTRQCHECGRTLPAAMTVHISPVTWDTCIGGADLFAATSAPDTGAEERLRAALHGHGGLVDRIRQRTAGAGFDLLVLREHGDNPEARAGAVERLTGHINEIDRICTAAIHDSASSGTKT